MSKLNVTGNDLLSFSQAVKGKLDTKQGNLTAGYGIAIDNDGTIRVTLDTTVAVVLPSLPTANEEAWNLYHEKLVLIPDSSSQEPNNVYIEYVISKTTSGQTVTYFWEKVGEQQLDLSNYYNKTETDAKLALKADKTDYFKVKGAVKAGVDLPDVSVDTTIDPIPVKGTLLQALRDMNADPSRTDQSSCTNLSRSTGNDVDLFLSAIEDILINKYGCERNEYNRIDGTVKNVFVKVDFGSHKGYGVMALNYEFNTEEDGEGWLSYTFLSVSSAINIPDLIGSNFQTDMSGSGLTPYTTYRKTAPCKSISSTELQTIIAALS